MASKIKSPQQLPPLPPSISCSTTAAVTVVTKRANETNPQHFLCVWWTREVALLEERACLWKPTLTRLLLPPPTLKKTHKNQTKDSPFFIKGTEKHTPLSFNLLLLLLSISKQHLGGRCWFSFIRCFCWFLWRFLCTVRTSTWIQVSMWGIHLSKLRHWRGCIQNVLSLVLWEDNNLLESVLFSLTLSPNRSKSGFKTAGTLIH